ncbi:MAG TPA: phosphotransferase [Caulobacteraceae bacterium]
MSSAREALKAEFLAANGLGDATRFALAGDASTRAYERLHTPSGQTLIFMDQPPHAETEPCGEHFTPAQRHASGYNALARLAAGRIEAFVTTATYLKSLGLSAPEVIAFNASAGLAVLEDLGDALYARLIGDGASETELYDAAIDALAVMHASAPSSHLTCAHVSWPLLAYDDLALKTAGDLFIEWLPQMKRDLSFGDEAAAEWEALWAPIRARGEAGADSFCHRDYHAENLIWLPERDGPARVGLLDFQDAVRGHKVWDFSMLLHDARRDVSAELEQATLERYFTLRPEIDREAFLADYNALGTLNVARILGIFSRLVVRDKKPRYAAFMPRLWGYLDRTLNAPGMEDLKAWFDRHVPAEHRT